jgi:hypothetical protein
MSQLWQRNPPDVRISQWVYKQDSNQDRDTTSLFFLRKVCAYQAWHYHEDTYTACWCVCQLF